MTTSQDALAVSRSELAYAEASRQAARLAERRGWLMRRLLLVADVIGLVVAYLVALALAPPAVRRPTRSRRSGRSLLFVGDASALGAARADPRALRPRRGANRPLDGRRCRRRLPGRHARDVGLPRHHARPRPSVPEPGAARRVLAPRRRAHPAPAGREPRDRPSSGRVHPERASSSDRDTSPTCSPTRSRSIRSTACESSASSTATTASLDRGRQRTHLIGTTDDLPELVREYGVHRVAIAFSTDSHDQTLQSDSLDAGQRRPDRHRPAHVRGARHQRPAPHDRRDAARRSSEPAPLRLVAIPQAVVRSCSQRRSGSSSCSRRSSSSSRS